MIRSVRISGERLRSAVAGAIRAIRAQDQAVADLAFEHGRAVGSLTHHASRITDSRPSAPRRSP